MTHKCLLDDENGACIEKNGELWIEEYITQIGQMYGRSYKVNFCPKCGFKLPTKSYFNFLHLPYTQVDDSIHNFSAELGKSISEMNHNIALIKAFMSAQNTQNDCFMHREMELSQQLSQIKLRLEKLENEN